MGGLREGCHAQSSEAKASSPCRYHTAENIDHHDDGEAVPEGESHGTSDGANIESRNRHVRTQPNSCQHPIETPHASIVDSPECACIPYFGGILLAFFVGNSLDTSCLDREEDVLCPSLEACCWNSLLFEGACFNIPHWCFFKTVMNLDVFIHCNGNRGIWIEYCSSLGWFGFILECELYIFYLHFDFHIEFRPIISRGRLRCPYRPQPSRARLSYHGLAAVGFRTSNRSCGP